MPLPDTLDVIQEAPNELAPELVGGGDEAAPAPGTGTAAGSSGPILPTIDGDAAPPTAVPDGSLPPAETTFLPQDPHQQPSPTEPSPGQGTLQAEAGPSGVAAGAEAGAASSTTPEPAFAGVFNSSPTTSALGFNAGSQISLDRSRGVTVVLIGMRGAGKSTYGRLAADLLCADFIDLDKVVSERNGGLSPSQIVQKDGWNTFRDQEFQALALTLKDSRQASVRILSCGGGILEHPASEDLITAHWPVVFIDRHIDDIVDTLEQAERQGEVRAASAAESRNVYDRRLPAFLRACNFLLPLVRGDADSAGAGMALARLVRQVLGWSRMYLGAETLVLQVNVASCLQVPPQAWKKALRKVDVVELRVDCLSASFSDERELLQEIAQLRRFLHGIPLLYSVRSVSQGGYFQGSEAEYVDLLKLGFRLGAEMVDVECTSSQAVLDELFQSRGTTRLMGSFVELTEAMPESEEQIAAVFRRCELQNFAAAVRVAVRGRARASGWIIQEIAELAVTKPFVALCLTGSGVRLSQLLNRNLCPVAAPLGTLQPFTRPEDSYNLLAAQELLAARQTMDVLTFAGRQFPVVGPWRSELPRLLSSVADVTLKERSSAHRCLPESASSDDLQRILELASVGGAMLIGPLKAEAYPIVNRFATAQAEAASAIDCIHRDEDGLLTGHSMERRAMCSRIEALGLCDDGGCQARTGLVLGSGASGRSAQAALQQLGFGRILHVVAHEEHSYTFTVTVDRSEGQRLGLDVSHDHGESLLVESINGGLLGDWNDSLAGPSRNLGIYAGDSIIEVNGARGSVGALVGQLGLDQLLTLRVQRRIEASGFGAELVEDLCELAPLQRLDVLVLAEPPSGGYYTIPGAQWLQPTINRLKPVVIETIWPPTAEPQAEAGMYNKMTIPQAAKVADCVIVEAMELFLERLCLCLELWMGPEVPGQDEQDVGARSLEIRKSVTRGLSKQLTARGLAIPPCFSELKA